MSARPERVLVPLDGSRLAESVLPGAFGMARALDAKVMLLHVLERRAPSTVHGEPHLRGAAEAAAYLESVAERARAAGVRVETHVHEESVGAVAAGIAEHAKELGTGLIALCTHGSGGVRGLLLGSIAQQTLRRGDATVLLVRPAAQGGTSDFRCREVALAVDPVGRHGRVALEHAAEVAGACGGTVHLIAVVPTAASLPPERRATRTLLPHTMKAVLDLEGSDAQRVLDDAAEMLKERGVPSTTRVLRGDPVDQVGRAIRDRPADLLVVATHARAGIGGWMEGSFAQRITSQLQLPTLLVRAPA
jgi:nucleotide-binding universal stress UspA family protein